MLGRLNVQRGDDPPVKFPTRETGLLLARLACRLDRPARRDDLIMQLWPQLESVSEGRNRFRIALARLREILDASNDSDGSVVLADRTEVCLNPDRVTTDIAEFELRRAQAQQAPDDATRAERLREAVALYRGELLPGYDAEWAENERRGMIESYRDTLKTLVGIEAQARQVHSALDYAHRLVQVDPLCEESHLVLIQLYKAAGRPHAALRQYHALARVLDETLGAKPSARSQNFIAQISSGTPAKAVKANGASGTGGGVAILGGNAPAPPPAFPDPLSYGLPNRNWARSRTRCFGREDDLTQVLEFLDGPEARLVTLTGLGGSGKTRLGLEVADRLFAELEGAVWFVPFASITDPNRMAEEIAAALRLPLSRTGNPLKQIHAALEEKNALLVLDNLEHLGDKGALFVHELLESVASLRCLVTSRQRLNLTGEREYAVLPLAVPNAPGTAERLLEFPSVQLFAESARSVRPDFEVSAGNAQAVADLCRHLDGVPLAIEIAAGWAQALTPAQILARMTPRLPRLTNRRKDVPARHASLRAALDWSYDLLAPEVQTFFTRLSVFRGGWTLEAAETVCSEFNAIEYLVQLRERSLLRVDEARSEMRYSLLETVREYGEERLAAEERAAIRAAHADFYRCYAEDAEPLLDGLDAPEWLDRLDGERDNFRAALNEMRPAPESCLALAANLWRFWSLRGHYAEGLEWLATASDPNAEISGAARLAALRAQGNLAYSCGQASLARACYLRQLDLARESCDSRAEAQALGSLGNVALDSAENDCAHSLLEQSAALFQKMGDARSHALALANLGRVAIEQERYRDAAALLEQALATFRRDHDKANTLRALNSLAYIAVAANDTPQARLCLDEAFTLARQLGDPFGLALSLANQITFLYQQGDYANAATLLAARDSLLVRYQILLTPRAQSAAQRDRHALQQILDLETYETAYQRGQSLTPLQIYAFLDRQPAFSFAL